MRSATIQSSHAGAALRMAAAFVLVFCRAGDAGAAITQQIPAPVDSAHWDFQGNAGIRVQQGRRAIFLSGGTASLKNFEMRDATIDFDVFTPAPRGFFGVEFRASGDDSEFVYLRQHKSGLPDALQYTPVLGTGLNWQLYSGPGFTGAAAIPRGVWFHVRLEVAGAQAKLFVGNVDRPVLVMDDLKSGVQRGTLAFAVLLGDTYFSNIEVRETDAVAWQRREQPMPEDILTRWSISPAYDALARDLERPLTREDIDTMAWEEVHAEPPGLIPVYRYRTAPHPRVTFQSDFSTRLQPQPGTQVVYARTIVQSDRDQAKKLELGYSDEVSVFLNGQILFRGRSAQSFRDPGFLGIVSPDNDAVYLPLRQGTNELILALSELGGGWGFISRLRDVPVPAAR